VAKPWDRSLKRLFKIVPEDFVAWLLPEATFVSVVSPELDSEDSESEAIYSSRSRVASSEVWRNVRPVA